MEIYFDLVNNANSYYLVVQRLADFWSGAVTFCSPADFVMRNLNTWECVGWRIRPIPVYSFVKINSLFNKES